MDCPDYANTQAYLKGLYVTASHSRLACAASAERLGPSQGLFARLRRGGSLVFHPGAPGPAQDQFEDSYLTLKLHIG